MNTRGFFRLFFAGATAMSLMSVFAHCGTEEDRVPVQYRLRQIMIEPVISEERAQAIYRRAGEILDMARGGEDFSKLAREYSEEPGADRTAGDLGFFTFDQMVGPFSKVVFSMRPDEITGPVETQFGYHIIKLLGIDGDKRHAQHILLKLEPGREDSLRTLENLKEARQRILDGEDFTAVLDNMVTLDVLKETEGYMVWQKPGDMLPSYTEAINGLGVGDVSMPFVSVIGFHIVLVDSINYDEGLTLEGFPAYIQNRLDNR